MSGRRSKRKGSAAEREFAKLIGGKRVPLSGAMGGEYSGDVIGLGIKWECKRRKESFKQLDKWLEGVDAVAFRADRDEWKVWMPLKTLLSLLEREANLIALLEKNVDEARRDESATGTDR